MEKVLESRFRCRPLSLPRSRWDSGIRAVENELTPPFVLCISMCTSMRTPITYIIQIYVYVYMCHVQMFQVYMQDTHTLTLSLYQSLFLPLFICIVTYPYIMYVYMYINLCLLCFMQFDECCTRGHHVKSKSPCAELLCCGSPYGWLFQNHRPAWELCSSALVHGT